MATIEEIKNLMSQPSKFDLMRQELQAPGTIAKHEAEQEKARKEEKRTVETPEKEPQTWNDFVLQGIEDEIEAIDFYEKMMKITVKKQKKIIQEIQNDEKNHKAILEAFRDGKEPPLEDNISENKTPEMSSFKNRLKKIFS